METEGKKILVDYLTDVADTFRGITGETDLIDARTYPAKIEKVAGGSGSKNSYQRGSIEEMNAITDAKDGDTCLCYYTNSFNITEDATVNTITFPEEVVFENAITEYYNAEIRAADSSIELFGMIDLSPNDFMFQVYKMDDNSRINAHYNSEDGITYTLEQPLDLNGSFELVNERTIDFKIDVNIQNTNEYIGAFLSNENSIFYGLFKYNGYNGGWKTLGLNYPLNNYNVEASQKYYNNGEQEGMLGKTDTKQGLLKLNAFIEKYRTGVTYPKNMSEYFSGYEGERIPLLELNPNTSNVTNMDNTFANCSSLKTIPALDTSNVTNMSGMFSQCSSLEIIPMLNTSNVTAMFALFSGCSSLETIPMLNTSNVVTMSSMFHSCSSLKTVPMLDVSNVTVMSEMFTNCSLLETVPMLSTGKVDNMYGMFKGCSSLKTVPMLDVSELTNPLQMFDGCSSLVTLGGLKNLGMGYDTSWRANHVTLNLSDSPSLTHDSLMNVINNLYDIKSKGVKTQTLQLGDTNKAKLTAEEIAIATNKGWNVI